MHVISSGRKVPSGFHTVRKVVVQLQFCQLILQSSLHIRSSDTFFSGSSPISKRLDQCYKTHTSASVNVGKIIKILTKMIHASMIYMVDSAHRVKKSWTQFATAQISWEKHTAVQKLLKTLLKGNEWPAKWFLILNAKIMEKLSMCREISSEFSISISNAKLMQSANSLCN